MVTRLAYGAMELRGDARGRLISEKQADRVLNSVLDSGINLIDTSIDYGRSEERIGRHISHRRSEFFLATKCGCPLERQESWRDSARWLLKWSLGNSSAWRAFRRLASKRQPPGRADRHSFTRENIIAGVEQSLRRMKTDYIDILQIHHTPPRAVLEEQGAIETLLDLKRQGKVRFIGVSARLPALADYAASDDFDMVQVPYSAFDREHETAIAEAAAAGIGTVIRAGIGGSGMGGLQRDPLVHDAWKSSNLSRLATGMSAREFNLRFSIGNPDVDTVLVGTANPAHVLDNVAALSKGPLPKDLIEETVRVLAARP